MNEAFASLTQLICEVVVPNLKCVQMSQVEQMAAGARLEQAIEELRLHLDGQFALLSAQLIACRAELAVTQAALTAAQAKSSFRHTDSATLVH